ncbi:MAG TPA: hypothetical protein VF813_05425, partial [Anaerolineaceae bacterium]
MMFPGDYFGEEAMQKHGRRPASADAPEPAGLMRLHKRSLQVLSKEFPTLRANLSIARSTHALLQSTRLNWLNPEEVIYLVARKHTYFLWQALGGPILLALAALAMFILLYFQVIPGTITPVLITGAVYLLALGWGIWNAVDWGNDYNVVTNQRVVWLERIAGIYDSRQEAPITTLLSVTVRTSQTGRWVGFGDVLVRTYTGTLTLQKVPHPQQIAALIEDHWTRSKNVSRQEELAKIETTLQTRLGKKEAGSTEAGLPQAGPEKTFHEETMVVRPGFFQRWFASFFHIRYEEGGVITYRKHWFILLKTTWLPVLGMLAAALALLRWKGAFTLLGSTVTYAVCLGALIACLLWYTYNFIDWRNDIYQVTLDQIVDAEKTPLGREERKTAPLENILSIEYRRVGLLGLMLNYGTVAITIGTNKFNFETVYNPSQVQQDVFRRMNERIEARRKDEIEAQRERISDWIMVYHENVRGQEEPPEVEANEPEAGI